MITPLAAPPDQYSSAGVKRLLDQLFSAGHRHDVVRSAFPSARDGLNGDVALVNDVTGIFVVVKVAGVWYKTAALTAV